jgi:two-component system chemotaxis response regulator CheB
VSILPEVLPGRFDAVLIGISTGGPQALRSLLPSFPAHFPAALAIVQHMPPGYTGPFAERLNEISKLEVLEAREGLEMRPGRAILAQAGHHLMLKGSPALGVYAHLSDLPAEPLHRPSVDVLFRSAAEAYGTRALGIVMTGMGNDGTEGAAWIKSQGGMVIAEDESSCVVFGMPRSVIEAGLADQTTPLSRMAETISEVMQ